MEKLLENESEEYVDSQETAVTNPELDETEPSIGETEIKEPEKEAISVETIIEQAVGASFERIATELLQAEARGFKRGLDTARTNPELAGITDNTVPNFLADIRRDVWEN